MLSRNVLHVMGMGCGREKEGKKKTRGKEASEEKKKEERKGKEPGGKERREATPNSLYTPPPPDCPPLAEITGNEIAQRGRQSLEGCATGLAASI